MTTAELIAVVQRATNEVSSTDALFYLNERQREMVAAAEYLEKLVTAFVTTVADQAVYLAADQDLTDVKELYVGDSETYYYASREQIRLLRAGRLQLDVGSPGAFAPYFDTSGAWGVEIYPTPESSGTAISALVIDDPPAMVSGGQVPVIPKHLHRYIAYGAIADLLRLDDEKLSEAGGYEALYAQGVQALRRAKLRRTGASTQIPVRGYHV